MLDPVPLCAFSSFAQRLLIFWSCLKNDIRKKYFLSMKICDSVLYPLVLLFIQTSSFEYWLQILPERGHK